MKDDLFAEDIVQDSFVYIWENQNDFNDAISTKVFLYRTVKNKCINQIKHQSARNKFEDNQPKDGFDENLFLKKYINEETIRLIYKAIESLPQNCRSIIELSLKGLKNEDIADSLNISVNTVKTHKKTAYKLLRIKLKDILPVSILLLYLLKN